MLLIQDIQKTFQELRSSMKRDRCQVDTVLQTVANEGCSSNTLSLIQKLYQLSGEAKVKKWNLMYLKVKMKYQLLKSPFFFFKLVCKYFFLEPLDFISALLFIIVWQVVNTVH